MIPRNLFGMALSVLPKQKGTLYRWQSRSVNEVGLDVNTYGPGEPFTGSFQAVDRVRYERLGLDAGKTYIMIYADTALDDLTRGKNPDQVGWQGERYEVMGRADWNALAGFNGVMAVLIGKDG